MLFNTPHGRLRLIYLLGSLLLPSVTGLWAQLAKFENGWSGFYQGFPHTFLDYAIPIPVAAGCVQIVAWPTSVGVAILLTVIPWRMPFLAVLGLWMVGYLIYWIDPPNYEWYDLLIYPLTNVAFVTVATTIWLIREEGRDECVWEEGQ